MPVAPASLSNLVPWTTATARLAVLKAHASRKAIKSEPIPDKPQEQKDRQLERLNRMLARTDNADRINKLLDARAKLLKQSGHAAPHTKPIPKITLRLP